MGVRNFGGHSIVYWFVGVQRDLGQGEVLGDVKETWSDDVFLDPFLLFQNLFAVIRISSMGWNGLLLGVSTNPQFWCEYSDDGQPFWDVLNFVWLS